MTRNYVSLNLTLTCANSLLLLLFGIDDGGHHFELHLNSTMDGSTDNRTPTIMGKWRSSSECMSQLRIEGAVLSREYLVSQTHKLVAPCGVLIIDILPLAKN